MSGPEGVGEHTVEGWSLVIEGPSTARQVLAPVLIRTYPDGSCSVMTNRGDWHALGVEPDGTAVRLARFRGGEHL